jgi:hypothetical protein
VEVCGHLHAPAALPPGREPLVPIGWEAGWAPEPFWTRVKRNIPSPRRKSNPRTVSAVLNEFIYRRRSVLSTVHRIRSDGCLKYVTHEV